MSRGKEFGDIRLFALFRIKNIPRRRNYYRFLSTLRSCDFFNRLKKAREKPS